MCMGCLEEHDAYSALPATENMLQAASLIEELYEYHSAGGPLHVITDDFNVEDSNLAFCLLQIPGWNDPYNAEDSPHVQWLSSKILDLLEPMTESQRGASIGIAHGYIDIVDQS